MKRRAFMEGLLSTVAILFRVTARAEFGREDDALTAKVTARGVGTATLTLAVMPKETKFDVEGNVTGLDEGDFVQFHIEENVVKWKGRELQISRVAFVP